MTFKQSFYEYDTPEGVGPPLYFQAGKWNLETDYFDEFQNINDFLDMRRHATLKAKLDKRVRNRIPIERGADGEDYFEMEYDLHAHYFSAHCEVSLWFKDKQQGSVKIPYI
jgi:hypothetical protein